jgi:hypothetical protein
MRHQDYLSGNYEDSSNKHNPSKYEYDLYREEDNIPGRVVQVKKIGNLKKGEKWRVLQDNKVLLTIDGESLTSKEKSFLYTVEGVTFIMNFFKKGELTAAALKKAIKVALSKNVKQSNS